MKKEYQTPVMTAYGDAASLTLGGTCENNDAPGGTTNNNDANGWTTPSGVLQCA